MLFTANGCNRDTIFSTFLDISPLQANLAARLTQRTGQTNKLSEHDEFHGIAIAVSIYQPKSEEWQVVSFNPNATATAIEQPPAAFGPGIAQEWCIRSPIGAPTMWHRDLDP